MQNILEGARTQGVVAQKVRRVRAILAASTMLGMPLAAASLGLMAPVAAQAQSAILAGDYIKVGINGTVGSLGYGGGTTPGILYDGSGTGTFNPAYDYLTPGSPFEGFVLTANGMTTAINNNAGGTAISGSLTSYSGIAYGGSTYDQRAVWTGTYGSLFSITNDYFFNRTSQQVGIRTTITALSDLTNLAFSRALDPDAVAAAGDSSATNNFRGNSTVSANDLVYAEALVSKYVIGLYTSSSYTHNAAVTGWTRDTASYLAGTDVGNGDNTIGLGFSLGSLLAGNSAVIDYAYIFGTDISKAIADAAGGRTNIATGVSAADVAAGNFNPVLSGGKITFGADQALSNDLTVDSSGGTIETTAANATLSGVISGDGRLTKTGTGTLTLTGANSYTGGTTVQAGKLVGDTASLTGSIVNDAVVEFAQGGDGSFGGGVSGTGALIKSGSGTLTLTGANSYTGGTTVEAGKLVGDTGSLTGGIVNDAVVEFAQGGDGSFGGGVSGTGALIKSGSGTLTLTGANSYTGGTTVQAGKLVGDTGSLTGGIVNDAIVEFAQGGDGSFGGGVSGTGALIKSGSGTLTLTGANSYTGGTTVQAGKLVGDTGSLTGGIVNDAIVEFAQGGDGSFGGGVSGTGALIKSGSGTLTLTGANSYTGGTTVQAGKLVGDTASLTGSIVNDAVVEFAQGGDGSFGGGVSGTGALIKSGSGTLTLTGANSYTGGTTVQAGKLVGDTASLTGSIVNDAIVEFAQGGDGSFGGGVSGTGALIKSGSGTLTLTGANSYSGGTTVQEGKLIGDTGSLQGTIVNNGTVEFAQAAAGTFAGALTGSGTVVKSGAGTLTLAGTAQRMTLDVTQGTVIAANQAAIGSNGGAIRLQNASTLTAGSNLTITQAVLVGDGGGVIDTGASTVRLTGGSMGGNCLIKQGSGTLVLASDAANAIGACVQQGTMSFDSTFAGNVFVDAVGTARGNGTVQGNMQVAGTLAPGNSPGRLVVAGSVTQGAGSTLSIDVDGTTAGVGAGHYDTLVLTGATSVYTAAGTLAPKLRGITGDATNSFTPTVGQTFEIVTAEGGVTGSFAALTQPSAGLAANTRFDVIYGSKAILLAVTPDSYARYLATGAGSNAVAAATALDAVRPAAGVRTAGTTGALFANLATLPGGAIGTSFQQLAGGLHADAIEAQLQANQAVRDTMVQRVRSRGTVAGEGARKTGLWGAFNAQRIDVDGDATGNGYRATSYGYTLGIDHQATDTLVLGLAATYKSVDTRATALGTAKVKGYGGALYGVWTKGPDYVTGVIDFNVDDYTVRRSVQLGGGVEALKGDGKGFSFGADIEAGHRFDLGALGVTPVAGIAYDRVERNAFGETGGSAALRFDGEGRTGWTGRAGVRVDGAVGSMVRPFVSAMAVQQLGDNRTALQARLVGARIDTRSVSVGDTQLRAEAGLSANLTGGVSVDLRYRYTGLGHADAHSGNAAISLRF